MESSTTTVPQFIHQSPNPKKRGFLGGSSSSGFHDIEVLEIDPPIKRSSSSQKRKQKQKQVVSNEIIDLDLEEDRHVILLDDDESDTLGKGKKVSANDGSGTGIKTAKKGDVENFSSHLFHKEDEWIDSFYEDILFEDANMDSHFNHMNFPAGTGAPFPGLQSSTNNNVPTTGNSKGSASFKFDFNPEINTFMSAPPDNSMIGRLKGLANPSTSSKPLLDESPKETYTRKTRSRSSNIGATATSTYPNRFSQGIKIQEPGLPKNGHGIGNPSVGPSTGFKGVSSTGPSTLSPVDQQKLDEIMHKFDAFKKFDTVEDCSDHHYYSKHAQSAKQPPKNWAKKIQDEWKILEKGLPAEIFVRVYESRMDLLRAVIVGAEGTPYHDGLFFFDVFFPNNYPNVPPNVHYHSGGLRINPNLYNCGKVCLSLLNTWSGSGKEKWIPRESTILQVLVSIQGLILNAKPYFNEPGYARMTNSPSGEKASLQYNENTFIYNLQTMGYSMRRPPKYFEDFVIGHFCKYGRGILMSCKAYLEGVQVGCLVKGGVQDLEEGDKSCSQEFKMRLAGCITTLVGAFSNIGAKDCQEFISLAQMGKVTAPPKTKTVVNKYQNYY